MSFKNFETVKSGLNSDSEEASFEEESLIERKTEQSMDSNSGKSSEDEACLNPKSKIGRNIVEVIDPTFKNQNSKPGLIERKISEIKAVSGLGCGKSLGKYETCAEDTDTFLPVQGQRRGQTVTKKNKSSGQCIQQ